MNTVTNNINTTQSDPRCLFAQAGIEKQSAPSVGAFNFNLQPYKFTAIENQRKIGIDERAELNRFIAFGKSLAF